jgi:anti-sigma B factor antagonist
MPYLSIAEHQDVVVVSIDVDKVLDAGTIRQIGSELSKLTLEAAGGRKLLLTFRRVNYMSSAMLGEIIRLAKQAKADRIDLKLCDISPAIMEVFRLMKLDKILDIRATLADGLAAFGPPGKGWQA